MLLARTIAVIVGMPIILVCAYYGGILFSVMMFMISLMCVKEYLIILKKYKPHFILSLAMSAVFFLYMCFLKEFPFDKVAVSVVVMLIIFFIVEIFGNDPDLSINRIAVSFIGAFFIPIAFVHMVFLRNFINGMELIFFIFIVVWILDTAAYAFGTLFGKYRLAKNISPKKTIEGAVIGTVFGVLAAIFCRYIFMKNILTFKKSIILGLVICVIGQFSDLAESLIKRDGGTKNSGKIIPGHGGFFDRFDSYIFVAPIVYYILQILL